MISSSSGTESHCPFSQQARNFDMFGADFQADPAQALRFSREGEPVFYSEAMGHWIVSRYQDIKAIFKDPITFSAYNVLEKLVPAPEEALAVLKSYNYAMDRTLVNEVEPVHMERRRLLLDAFTPVQLERHRTAVQQIVQDRVDGFLQRGRVDLVDELLWDVPLTVALQFLGVPDEDKETLRRFSAAHTVNIWGRPTPDEQLEVANAVGQFWEYSGRVLNKMIANPSGEGWMYDMIAKNRIAPDIVTGNFLHSMIMAILVAAHETTSLASANAIKLLLSDPVRWQKLCENPALVPAAVEECLRHSGSIVAWRRQTTQEVTLGGIRIPEGAKLFVVTASANHDPDHFENPDEWDVYRDNSSEHLTFGYGAHQCLGKNLARMEMCIFIETLTRRIPGLRLARQQFSYLPNTSFRGPKALWVEWDEAEPEARVPTVFRIGGPDIKSLVRSMVVTRRDAEARDIVTVSLSAANGAALPRWSPGSHVELMLPNGEGRKYSLCGRAEAQHYTLAIQLEAEGRGGSKWFHENLRPGMEIAMRGPKNFFRFDPGASTYLLIAGGIGITPIITMADALRAAGKSYRLVYLVGERERIALKERVTCHADSAIIHVSGEAGRLGLSALIDELPAGAEVCACGPTGLLDTLALLVQAKSEVNLRVEHFAPVSAIRDSDAEEAFDVELLNSGVTLTVPQNRTLLEVLHSAGLDVPYDCGEGLCGSCEVNVAGGEIDHRDRVLSGDERCRQDRMMACCSRGKGPLKLNL